MLFCLFFLISRIESINMLYNIYNISEHRFYGGVINLSYMYINKYLQYDQKFECTLIIMMTKSQSIWVRVYIRG